MTYQELISTKQHNYISYTDLLGCDEWNNKRNKIKERDNQKCKKCDKKKSLMILSNSKPIYFKKHDGEIIEDKTPTRLEVHHKLYVLNKLPWEYEDDDLMTVCNKCHEEIHKNEEIHVFDESKNHIIQTERCTRCGGSGFLPEYDHVEDGICFKCRGVGRNIPI